MIRILIGIMHCIENEYEQCVSSILNQQYGEFEHFVVKNLPNKKAHQTLYQKFMDSANKFDLFIKVDADMVLTRHTFFSEIIEFFTKNPKVQNISIPVQDFFTNRMIHGLHVFRNDVRWKIDSDIFVDSNTLLYTKKIIKSGPLVPAAFHCPDPSLFQAYHFGLHKSFKFLQLNHYQKRKTYQYRHFENITALHKNLKKNRKDKRLIMAMIGVYDGVIYRVLKDDIDFNSKRTIKRFKGYEKESLKSLNRIMQIKRIRSGLILPDRLVSTYFPILLDSREVKSKKIKNYLKRITRK